MINLHRLPNFAVKQSVSLHLLTMSVVLFGIIILALSGCATPPVTVNKLYSKDLTEAQIAILLVENPLYATGIYLNSADFKSLKSTVVIIGKQQLELPPGVHVVVVFLSGPGPWGSVISSKSFHTLTFSAEPGHVYEARYKLDLGNKTWEAWIEDITKKK